MLSNYSADRTPSTPDEFAYFDNCYFPDATETDQGIAGNNTTVKDIVDLVGTSQSATIIFNHDSSGDTTTYTLTTSETIPSNFRVVMQKGSIIDGAGTLTQNGPFVAIPRGQCFDSRLFCGFFRPQSHCQPHRHKLLALLNCWRVYLVNQEVRKHLLNYNALLSHLFPLFLPEQRKMNSRDVPLDAYLAKRLDYPDSPMCQ